MQRLLRRAAFANAQAERRLARKKERFLRDRAKSAREQAIQLKKEEILSIKTARKARREDWELGELAPRRDVGLKKDTYGTVDMARLRGQHLSREERLKVNPEGGRYPNIVPGDRVVILEGRDKGKIGKVEHLDTKTQEVTVENLNLVDVAIPKWMINQEDGDKRPIRTMPKPLSVSSVRLVFPYTDPETGVTRDVIATKVVNGNIYYDRYTGKKGWTRYVADLDIPIPWPKVEPKQHKDYDCDTLRIDVETKTFVPSLLRPPMPVTVIDELRNKFSKFRTRHDEEYIRKKEQEEVEEQRKVRMVAEMRTPLKELRRAELKQLKAKGKPKLTDEMLAKIGEVIAKNSLLESTVPKQEQAPAAP